MVTNSVVSHTPNVHNKLYHNYKYGRHHKLQEAQSNLLQFFPRVSLILILTLEKTNLLSRHYGQKVLSNMFLWEDMTQRGLMLEIHIREKGQEKKCRYKTVSVNLVGKRQRTCQGDMFYRSSFIISYKTEFQMPKITQTRSIALNSS